MAKVWKAYVAKHGENPYSADDLMFFSQKCRTVKALSSDRALQVFNKHKDKKPKSKKTKHGDQPNDKSMPLSTNQKSTRKSSNANGRRAASSLSISKPSKSNKSNKKSKPRRVSTQSHLQIDTKSLKKSRRSSTDESSPKKRKRTKNRTTHQSARTAPNLQGAQSLNLQSSPSLDRSPVPSTTTPTKSLFIAVDDDDEELKTNPEPMTPPSPHTTPSSPSNENGDISDVPGLSMHSKSLNLCPTTLQLSIERNASADDVAKMRRKRPSKKGKRYFAFKQFAAGAFSKVYRAKDRQNGDRFVAIKKILIGVSKMDSHFAPTTKEEGENEVSILRLVGGHSNICDLIETYFDHSLGVNGGYVLCIVMSYMQYTLKQRMEYYADKGDHIPFHLNKIYLFQLCKAVSYMHSKNVCHRDIKPENVLVDASTNRLQLCDFGCSILLDPPSADDEKGNDHENKGNDTYVMSRYYRAPELILGNRFYGVSADIWSLGVVFSELFLGTIMFMGSSNKDQLREIILKLGWPSKKEMKQMNPRLDRFDVIDGVYGVDKKTKGESWSMIFMAVFDMEVSAVDCIGKLLVYAPDQRMSALQCLGHPYFDGVKSLMSKSRKNAKKGKKQKKESVVPLDLFHWTEEEIHFAKVNQQKLRT